MAADGSQQCAAEPPVEPAEPGYRMETRAAAIVLGARGGGFFIGLTRLLREVTMNPMSSSSSNVDIRDSVMSTKLDFSLLYLIYKSPVSAVCVEIADRWEYQGSSQHAGECCEYNLHISMGNRLLNNS